MQNQEIDIETLKKDEEFLENLLLLEKEMKEQESIAAGYRLLDAKLVIEAKEDEINEIFTFIVNTAFDKLAQNLVEHKKFKMDEAEDLATARAIYEHGIQRYSENDKKGAKEIFLVLHYILDHSELKDAMMVHAAAVMAGHTFDDFIENLVDVNGVNENDPLAFFIQTFTQPTDILLTMFSKYVKEAKEELKVLEESR
jgi:anion-transporting  ArsA/GET3 family ATPase